MGSRCCQAQFLLEAHGIITFDLNFNQFVLSLFIRSDIILIVCSHKIYIDNCFLVIKKKSFGQCFSDFRAYWEKKKRIKKIAQPILSNTLMSLYGVIEVALA